MTTRSRNDHASKVSESAKKLTNRLRDRWSACQPWGTRSGEDRIRDISISRETVSKAFERPPLEDVHSDIRLIRLIPSDDADAPIQCTLETHRRDDVRQRYVAISYTWGSVDPTIPIIVNGSTLHVRRNCWLTLWQMRLHQVSDLYWLDSICIDQEYHQEKKSQVAQMGELYSDAGMVAVCIGEHATDLDTQWVYSRAGIHSLLQHFFRREYFRRLWTVQECCLARYLRVYCGRQWIDFHHLARGLTSRERIPMRKYEDSWMEFFSSCDARSGRHQDLDLSQAILLYGMRGCYDPRDKIFGLLPMTSPATRQRINIDYSKSLWDVLLDYAGVYNKLVEDSPKKPHRFSKRRFSVTPKVDDFTSATSEMWESVQLLGTSFSKADEGFRDNMRTAKRRQTKHVSSHHAASSGEAPSCDKNNSFVYVELTIDGVHTIALEAGDYLDTMHHFYVQDSELPPANLSDRSRAMQHCTCCLHGSHAISAESEHSLPFQDSTEPSFSLMPELPAGSPVCLIKGGLDHWQGVHAFQVPAGTRDGDRILYCQATLPIIADRRQRVVFVGRPKKDDPERLEIIGRATHLMGGWPCPVGFRLSRLWNADVKCSIQLPTEQLLLALLSMERGMNPLMSILADGILPFPDLLPRRPDIPELLQIKGQHRTASDIQVSKKIPAARSGPTSPSRLANNLLQKTLNDGRDAKTSRVRHGTDPPKSDSYPEVVALDTHDLVQFLTGMRPSAANSKVNRKRADSPAPDPLDVPHVSTAPPSLERGSSLPGRNFPHGIRRPTESGREAFRARRSRYQKNEAARSHNLKTWESLQRDGTVPPPSAYRWSSLTESSEDDSDGSSTTLDTGFARGRRRSVRFVDRDCSPSSDSSGSWEDVESSSDDELSISTDDDEKFGSDYYEEQLASDIEDRLDIDDERELRTSAKIRPKLKEQSSSDEVRKPIAIASSSTTSLWSR